MIQCLLLIRFFHFQSYLCSIQISQWTINLSKPNSYLLLICTALKTNARNQPQINQSQHLLKLWPQEVKIMVEMGEDLSNGTIFIQLWLLVKYLSDLARKLIIYRSNWTMVLQHYYLRSLVAKVEERETLGLFQKTNT